LAAPACRTGDGGQPPLPPPQRRAWVEGRALTVPTRSRRPDWLDYRTIFLNPGFVHLVFRINFLDQASNQLDSRIDIVDQAFIHLEF
jgi:hypothetical protein